MRNDALSDDSWKMTRDTCDAVVKLCGRPEDCRQLRKIYRHLHLQLFDSHQQSLTLSMTILKQIFKPNFVSHTQQLHGVHVGFWVTTEREVTKMTNLKFLLTLTQTELCLIKNIFK